MEFEQKAREGEKTIKVITLSVPATASNGFRTQYYGAVYKEPSLRNTIAQGAAL